ncbi:hypothetical protein [Actinotalea subterranea]|uniref:hypothetical protein n=1 Tax=Actinotalea subterranea TaxID=2607497 RepID=UPI0011F084C2|nr:hypothetical protein [Actinotalea subterranea]
MSVDDRRRGAARRPTRGGGSTDRRPGWRLRVAIDEGLRNWRCGRWLTALLAVLLVAGFTVPAVADTLQVSRMVEDERAWEAAGGRLLVATNEAAGVPRLACERLTDLAGVEASASLTRLVRPAALVTAPGAAIPVVAATEGVADLLGIGPVGSGAVLATDLGQTLRLRPGDTLALTPADEGPGSPAGPDPGGRSDGSRALPAGVLTVAAVTDLSLLGEQRSGGMLLTVAAEGTADACFVRLAPGYVEAARAALPAVLQADGTPAVVTDRLLGGEFARDYAAEYDGRGLRNAPWAIGLAAAMLWLLVRWVRRGQEGLYATLGARWPVRTTMRLVEWCALVGTVALAAVVLSGAILLLSGVEPAITVPHVLRFVLVATLSSTAGAALVALVPLQPALAVLKDR